MAKTVYFPWDKVPEEVYHADLTNHEYGLIESGVAEAVKNIFKREKDPVKRAVMLGEVSRVATSKVINASAKEETKRKMQYHKKENIKMVKKMKEKKKKNKKK